ncbi:type III secretion protein [Stutzerimonas nosocomialis]|uniref:Type III secretion protein n=1 Tax=Stutzerimonas nosocomialis TaxID=1056496 RepID=A0A5R9QEU4_9GAMM|nr:tetratricopeptide repeat protein [Stutzerimonas nosocomialis]TLX63669.1 type III secretion protein [Stutzerimonas nosocomialis]
MSPRDREAARLLQGLGEIYQRCGQPQKALVMFLLASQILPDDAALLRSLVIAFTAQGDGERALRALERMVALEGESPGAWLLRSRACWHAGRAQDARASFQRYLQERQRA